MFIIRRAKVDDADTLLKLARMVHFINLPPDKEIIVQKIIHSRNSFLRVANARARPEPEPVPKIVAGLNGVKSASPDTVAMKGLGSASAEVPLFLFVMEETESAGVIGTSQVLAQMGGEENPNVSFKLEKREFFSSTLQTGTSQMVARMHLDGSGPSEIGGLIIQPSYRGHKMRLGRFLSFVRFHFMGMHRKLFADRVLAEMMAPITSDGDNLLWDYLGRRFVPLSYDEADRFCQYSREFITSLLPKEDIYLSLLPPAARAVVGEVGPETRPARRMLEKLGFGYRGFVDPFDGGPHLDAQTDEISLVKQTSRFTLGEPVAADACDRVGLMSGMQSDGDFFSACDGFTIGRGGKLRTTRPVMDALHMSPGALMGVTPTDGLGAPPRVRSGASAKKPKPKTSSGSKTRSTSSEAGSPRSKTAKKAARATASKAGVKTSKASARRRASA